MVRVLPAAVPPLACITVLLSEATIYCGASATDAFRMMTQTDAYPKSKAKAIGSGNRKPKYRNRHRSENNRIESS